MRLVYWIRHEAGGECCCALRALNCIVVAMVADPCPSVGAGNWGGSSSGASLAMTGDPPGGDCQLPEGVGGVGLVDGLGRFLKLWTPILHRRLRPESGIVLCFVWLFLFIGSSLGLC